MVHLTRIYTRGGDSGQTSLGDGLRVPKYALRITAYGTVDEANSTIGVARLHTTGESDAMLLRIQNDLFDLGADLCIPEPQDKSDKKCLSLRVIQSQVDRLEAEIDVMNANLQPIKSFVLPGGRPAAAYLHLARTVTRRAERLITKLSTLEPINPLLIKYVNRLSDHLFVLARWLNDRGVADILWLPGINR
jgi:cob(I)alamin adenosyltransferase